MTEKGKGAQPYQSFPGENEGISDSIDLFERLRLEKNNLGDVLDLGCGAGFHAQEIYFTREVESLTCVERNLKLADECNKRFNDRNHSEVINSCAPKIIATDWWEFLSIHGPERDHPKFDNILALGVLEEEPRIGLFLRAAAQMLKNLSWLTIETVIEPDSSKSGLTFDRIFSACEQAGFKHLKFWSVAPFHRESKKPRIILKAGV